MQNIIPIAIALLPLLILAFFNRWAVVAGLSVIGVTAVPIIGVLSAGGQGDSGSPMAILFFSGLIALACLGLFIYTRRKVSAGWTLLGAIAWTVSGIIVFGI
jgi:hypothetical protein